MYVQVQGKNKRNLLTQKQISKQQYYRKMFEHGPKIKMSLNDVKKLSHYADQLKTHVNYHL